MSGRTALVCSIAAVMTLGHPSTDLRAAVAAAPIDVHFTLTDLDYKPISRANVRLLFGPEPEKQPPTAGRSFVTDAAGTFDFATRAIVDKRMKKLPTNFADSLLSTPKETDHLTIAAEFEYTGFQWLYVVEVFRFPNGGDVLLDGFSVFNHDRQGRFTNKATFDGRDWKMPDLNGLMLTTAGYDVWDHALQPKDGVSGAWTLKLAFKKYPEPIRR